MKRHKSDVLTEDPLVIDLFDDKPRSRREDADQNVTVKEEGNPRGWLMF